jgi:ketopantoate reductase
MRFTADLGQIGTVDLVLFCVKSMTPTASRPRWHPYRKRPSYLHANGIDNTEKIACHWGAAPPPVLLCWRGVGPGVIEHSTGGRTISAAAMARPDQRSALSNKPCLGPNSLNSAPTSAMQWHKLLWNAAFCAISCLTRATTQEIVESDRCANWPSIV